MKNVFAPQQVGELALAEIQAGIDAAGMGASIDIAGVNKVFKPIRPGKLCTIQAYTSNYKTGFMTWWARRLAHNILDREQEKEIVVYVSWEDTVEDMGIYDLAHKTVIDVTEIMDGKLSDESMKRLSLAAGQRGALPEWVIGNSLADRRKVPPMTLTMVEDSLGWIEQKMGYHATAIFLDYVNLIQPENSKAWGDNRRVDIMENTYRARSLGLANGAAVIMGAQSKREANLRNWKLPQKWDALESSALEQYSDTMLSLWMPNLTDPQGPLHGPDGAIVDGVTINEHLLVMGVMKQKKGAAGEWWPLYVDAAKNEIGPMETKAIEF